MWDFIFFRFDPQILFFDDQALFKKQLISNSYEMMGLKDGIRMKNTVNIDDVP